MQLAPIYDVKTTLFSAIQKLSTTFADEIGNSEIGTGTGFWFQTDHGEYFVTNRHNVDPSMRYDQNKSYTLRSVSIWQRAYDLKDALPLGDVKLLELPISKVNIYWPSDKSDVVILQPMNKFAPLNPNHVLICLHETLMIYSQKPEVFDNLYFMGFPGKARKNAAYDFPIVRSCTISSFTEIDYSDEDKTIPSRETCLVEGLSFAGSSGSPVLRINEKNDIELMGIMSGHFKEAGITTNQHSGLSYFTKASSIQKLIKDHKL